MTHSGAHRRFQCHLLGGRRGLMAAVTGWWEEVSVTIEAPPMKLGVKLSAPRVERALPSESTYPSQTLFPMGGM